MKTPERPLFDQIFEFGCVGCFSFFAALVVFAKILIDFVISLLMSPITWIVVGIIVIVVIGFYLYLVMSGQGGNITREKRINKIFMSESAFRKKYISETIGTESRYIGEWKDDKHHGQGTFTYSDGTSETGIWKDGEYIG